MLALSPICNKDVYVYFNEIKVTKSHCQQYDSTALQLGFQTLFSSTKLLWLAEGSAVT